ncbi:MAG: ABC transporter permease [Phycisphaerales bacterium]
MSTRQPQSDAQTPPGVLRLLLRSQEIGLLVVISLMMLGLTLGTPSITTSDLIPQPADATAERGDESFTITANGTTTTYKEADGYSLRFVDDENGESHPLLVHQYQVNKFFNKNNLMIVATTASFIAVMAIGMTGIIIMGGIDLSIGSIYALAGVAGAALLHSMNAKHPDVSGWQTIPLGVLVCTAVGAACGLVNGVATVGLRVHPFIITLGGLAVFRGIAFVTTQGQSIGDFPASFTSGGFKAEFFGVTPVPALIMLAVAAIGAFVFSRSTFGRHTYAIGGNEIAAKYAGVPVTRVKVMLFVLAGLLAGLSAAMKCGYFGASSSGDGSGYELRVIAASVVGGASLSGGRGSLVGAMLGAIVMQLIDNSIVVLGIDSNYTNIVIGLAIVLAVVVDQAKARFLRT